MDAKLRTMKRVGLSPKYWCTTDELTGFFGYSYATLNRLFKADNVPFHVAKCLNYYYKFYLRPAAIRAILARRKKRKGRLPAQIPVLKSLKNKHRYISLKDAALLYNITIADVGYRLSKCPHKVYAFIYCSMSKGYPVMTKYFDKEQLDAAMSYFLSHKYSVTGRLRLPKTDKYSRMKSDVQSWAGKGSKKRALLEHLGLNSNDFME